MSALPPVDLTCPDPARCPVPDALDGVGTTTLAAGRAMFRGYDGRWGYDEHNPGYGDSRFAPVDDPLDGRRLPSIYLAESRTAALLETVFHELHNGSARLVYEHELRGTLLAHVTVPRDARVADLRDPALARLEVDRARLPAVWPEHYPCTRRFAVRMLAEDPGLQGIVWHSRQAELMGQPPAEVAVLFGHRYPDVRGSWTRVGPGSQNLVEGPGRLLVDELALALGATVIAE